MEKYLNNSLPNNLTFYFLCKTLMQVRNASTATIGSLTTEAIMVCASGLFFLCFF